MSGELGVACDIDMGAFVYVLMPSIGMVKSVTGAVNRHKQSNLSLSSPVQSSSLSRVSQYDFHM